MILSCIDFFLAQIIPDLQSQLIPFGIFFSFPSKFISSASPSPTCLMSNWKSDPRNYLWIKVAIINNSLLYHYHREKDKKNLRSGRHTSMQCENSRYCQCKTMCIAFWWKRLLVVSLPLNCSCRDAYNQGCTEFWWALYMVPFTVDNTKAYNILSWQCMSEQIWHLNVQFPVLKYTFSILNNSDC